MDEIKTDQVGEETKAGQSSTEQSEKTQEEPVTAEKAFDLARGLQKGYTQTRQEIAEIRENLQSIAESLNKQTGASQGDEDYVTTGKLKEILSEHTNQVAQAKEAEISKAESYLESTLTALKAEGIVKNKEEEEELLNYALAKKERDLVKAAERWQEIKQAKEEARKEITKTKERQKEGSVVGTSSKSGSTDEQGINYTTMKRMMARGEI